MYRGVAAETPATTAAVRATAGRVVTYQGAPVTTFFFSTSGGRTENIENSFVGADPKPWLKSVADPYDTVSPYHRWKSTRMTLAQATAALRGIVKGRLRRITRDQARRLAAHRPRDRRRQRRDDEPSPGRSCAARSACATRGSASAASRPPSRRSRRRRPAGSCPSVPATPKTTIDPTTGGAARAATSGPRIHGVIAPAATGAWASVERRERGRWVRAVDVQLGAGGTYTTTLPGPGSYRVRYAGQTGPVVSC